MSNNCDLLSVVKPDDDGTGWGVAQRFDGVPLVSMTWQRRSSYTAAACAGRSAMNIQKMTMQISAIRMRLPKDFMVTVHTAPHPAGHELQSLAFRSDRAG